MALEDRTGLGKRLKALLMQEEDLDSFIYGAGTRGLLSSALNETVMYCEDLFALVKFIREPEYFAKRVVQYKAGKVIRVASQLAEMPEDNLLKLWMVPDRFHLESVGSVDALNRYDDGCRNLISLVGDICQHYLKWCRFHNHYKHGLKIPMIPYNRTLPEESIAQFKEVISTNLWTYDSSSIREASAAGRLKKGMMLPDLSPELRPHMVALQEEGNLLRYHYEGSIDIDTCLQVGQKILLLIDLLLGNRDNLVDASLNGSNTFQLPQHSDGRQEAVQVTVVPEGRVLGIDDFQVKL